jgi:hypothetical protein
MFRKRLDEFLALTAQWRGECEGGIGRASSQSNPHAQEVST